MAHGDFDDTHIFRVGGTYSGVIDFGEMRGAPPLYDAAHYPLHDRPFARPTSPSLLEGYADVLPLPDDLETQIAILALLIGVRVLALVADRPVPEYQRSLRDGIREAAKRLLRTPSRTLPSILRPSWATGSPPVDWVAMVGS